MAYCTIPEFKTRYSQKSRVIAQLTGDPTGQLISDVKIDEAIVVFSETIDSFMRIRFEDLSVLAGNSSLNSMNMEGALLLLYKWSEGGFNEEQRIEWKDLYSRLRDIAAGATAIVDIEQQDQQTSGLFSTERRVMGRSETL